MNILKQASEEWEVVLEPVARWCNVQQSSEDDCEVKGEKKKVKCSSNFRIAVYPTDWVFFRLCVIATFLLIAFTMSEFVFSSLLGLLWNKCYSASDVISESGEELQELLVATVN